MSRTRRHFTAEQKATVVRRHLSDKVPVSNLADELCVQPSQIHLWAKQLLDQAAKAFERTGGVRRDEQANDQMIAHLESKLAQKNEVVAELAGRGRRLRRNVA